MGREFQEFLDVNTPTSAVLALIRPLNPTHTLYYTNQQAATSAPLIERSIERATGIVYNITGGRDLTLQEVNRVSEVVTGLADPSANVIFGAVIDDQYEGEIHVTIIATGFNQSFEDAILSGKTNVVCISICVWGGLGVRGLCNGLGV